MSTDGWFTLDGLEDVPGHSIIAAECQYPDCVDGGVSLTLNEWCVDHNRSVYWCLNTGHLWCDGGPPEWAVHRLHCCEFVDEKL